MSNDRARYYTHEQAFETVDAFDRALGEISGLPDVTSSREATITVTSIVESSTFIVQTFRQRDVGDRLFVQRIDKHGSVRMFFPPRVVDAIARQRDALTGKTRSKAAKTVAADRKAAGIEPTHLLRPDVRKRALAARKRNAAARRAKTGGKR